jgi:histone H3/H4
MSVWNPDNIRDVAESVGIVNLNHDVTENLARDVEYRIAQVLEEALKAMRHGRRTILATQDIALALRNLDVEPLYGYDSTRPLKFGEASLGPGQPLFYVEDEEVDFEKLINAPLPKVPREVSFTGKWILSPRDRICCAATNVLLQLIGRPSKVCSHQFPRTLPLPILATSNSSLRARTPTPHWEQ